MEHLEHSLLICTKQRHLNLSNDASESNKQGENDKTLTQDSVALSLKVYLGREDRL